MRNAIRLFLTGGLVIQDGIDGALGHEQFRNVVIDGEHALHLAGLVLQKHRAGLEDAPVAGLGEITAHVAGCAGILVLQGFEHDARRPIAELPLGDMAVFNGHDGMFGVPALEVMHDDLAVVPKLFGDGKRQSLHQVEIHRFLPSHS